ncbi:hypothetical protein Tco_0365061 [Tanacetum coccineum]
MIIRSTSIGLEQFRDNPSKILSPKVRNMKFVDPPLETEIHHLSASLGHSGTPSYEGLQSLSSSNLVGHVQPVRTLGLCIILCGKYSFSLIETKSSVEGQNDAHQVVRGYLAMALTNEDIRNSNHTIRVPDAHDYDSDDEYILEVSDEEEDDDEHDDDENDQEDDDASDDCKEQLKIDDDEEKLTESSIMMDTDEDDSSISSSDEDDSDNDVEGAKVAGAKSGEDAISCQRIKEMRAVKVYINNESVSSQFLRIQRIPINMLEAALLFRQCHNQKDQEDGADDDQEPSAGTDRGSKRRRSGKEPASTSAPSETTTRTAGQTTDTDVAERPADQEFETGVQDEQAEEEAPKIFPELVSKTTRDYPSPDHGMDIRLCSCVFDAHDELHKFSDGTLDDVRTVLNDRLKGIRMEYLPETFWSQRDKANARAMIQAIDKRLMTRG